MKPYRPNVGIVVFNDEGKVLVGERIQYPGIFQFPQGGIDDGEEPYVAALRELYEETSLKLDDNQPAGEISEWLYYDFPEDIPEHLKMYQGQKQKWYFFHWNGDITRLELDIHVREFSTVKWEDLTQVVSDIVEFKRPVYLKVARAANECISGYHSKKI